MSGDADTTGWRDMDAAPLDDGARVWIGAGHREGVAIRRYGAWFWDLGNVILPEPDRWMPLEERPNAAA